MDAAKFDVAVIGGGAAGLTAAGLAASFGAKTLLVERAKLGGECTWAGCIPSKTLLKAAKVAHQQRHASRYGLVDHEPRIDVANLFDHVRRVRADVYERADAPPHFEAMGIDVRHGAARFVGPHEIAITTDDHEQQRIHARFVILATGARAQIPDLPGLGDVPHFTHETMFERTELPRRLLVVGGGPVGCELAQALQRLGTEIHLVTRDGELLSNDDPELAGTLRRALEAEGVRVYLGAEVTRLQRHEGAVRVTLGARSLMVDAVLLAAGRLPNVEGLALDRAGVTATAAGIPVDPRCRTNVRHVFACGDVTGRHAFTHMAEHTAKVAATNAVLRLPMKVDAHHVAWCTFTDPELAHLGRSATELTRAGVAFKEYRFPFDRIDRAITDGSTIGSIKIFATPRSGRILGASLLGEGAGELVCELALAMRNGVSLRQIADTIHPYPTLGLGVRRAADQWYVQKRSHRAVRFVQWLFGYRGLAAHFDPDQIV